MADPVTPTEAQIVDDARSAAAGTRTTARWLAAALGTIPGLALVTTLVSGPGDAGFHEGRVFLGVGLAALGAVLGLSSFVGVLAPVPLADRDLQNADIGSILGSRRKKFSELTDDLNDALAASAEREGELSEAEAEAKRAEVEAARAEAYAANLEAGAKDGDAALKKQAKEARDRADEKELGLEEAAGNHAALSARSNFLFEQVERLKALRHEAYLLKAGEVVGSKFETAQAGVVVSVALIAVGVGFLAIAPKPKAHADTSAVSLVTLSPNDEGKRELGCERDHVAALRIGGKDDSPKVITLPSADCPSRVIVFNKAEPDPLGTLKEEKEAGASP